MWIGRRLAGSFARLDARYGAGPFDVREAEDQLGLDRPRTLLTLSRLARAGWLSRIAPGTYVSFDARWALAAGSDGPLNRYQREPFFPVLVVAVSGALHLLGSRLRSIALFGSCARGDHRPDSDIDLLVVVEGLSPSLTERVRELWPLIERCRRVGPRIDRRAPASNQPQILPLSPAELESEPPILLDLTEDADVLFDPEGDLRRVLRGLAQKLRRHGARRVRPMDGPAYWVIHPGARVGEVSEI